MLIHIMVQNQHYSPGKIELLKSQYPDTMVPDNKKAPTVQGRHSLKIGGMWILKHEIRLPKFYGILLKTEIKGYTALDRKNIYNHIKMCLKTVSRLQEELISDYHSTKRHSYFEEYFVPDSDHPSYSLNAYAYNYLVKFLFAAFRNYTCVK